MDNLIWKIKQWLRKAAPFALAALVLYGAWNVYKRGSLTRGLKYTVNSVMSKVPVIGSAFKSSKSYSYSGKHHRRGKKHRRHRRHR